MTLKTITYSALRSTGNFSHDKFEATAEIGPHDNDGDAALQLRDYVLTVLGQQGKCDNVLRSLEDEIQIKQWKADELDRTIQSKMAKIDRMSQFLEQHGVKAEYREEEVPF